MKKLFQGTKDAPMYHTIATGVMISVLVSLIGAAGLTGLVISQRISESSMHYYAFVIQFLASGTGALISAKMANSKCAIISGIVAGVYMVLLLASGILFFDSTFSGVTGSVLSVLLGAGAACAICIGKGGRSKNRKRAFR